MDAMELIKQLREETGVSVMDCKRALDKSGNDLEKARIILKEEGLSKADKKAERETKAGVVAIYVSEDGKKGAVVEFRCETDFVAKNEEFAILSNNIAKIVALTSPSSVDDLLQKTDENGETVDALIRNLVAKIGEKMEVARFDFTTTTGYLNSYIHAGSKIGVLLEMSSDKDIWSNSEAKEFTYDIAMQIAAMSPVAVSPENLSEQDVKNVKDYIEEELTKENKPEEIKVKIRDGRIQKRFSEICLSFQPFIKNDSLTVGKLVEEKGKQLDAKINIVGFIRYQI